MRYNAAVIIDSKTLSPCEKKNTMSGSVFGRVSGISSCNNRTIVRDSPTILTGKGNGIGSFTKGINGTVINNSTILATNKNSLRTQDTSC